MTVYATCTACNTATRLTRELALKIAAVPGPPVSPCCGAHMRIDEVDAVE